MAESKHTPGQWLRADRTVYALESNGFRRGVEQHRNRFTAYVQAGPDTPAEEVEANARLIAAAPDLLEALKQAFPRGVATDNRYITDEQVIPLDFTMGELRRIAAAISKAEGQ